MRTVFFSAVALGIIVMGCDGNPPGGTTGGGTTGTTGGNDDCASCPINETCILHIDGTMGCGVPDIYDEIRTEAHKSSDELERPLPLAALWCSGPSQEAKHEIFKRVDAAYIASETQLSKKEGGSVNLQTQLQIIGGTQLPFAGSKQHHLLPTIDMELPKGNNKMDDGIFNMHGNFPIEGGYGPLALLRHFPHLRDWRNELDRFWLMQQKSWPFDVVWCRLPT